MDEEEEESYCEFCGSEAETKEYTINDKTGNLCMVCATTFSGNAFFYPGIHRGQASIYQISELMSQHTNFILRELKKEVK